MKSNGGSLVLLALAVSGGLAMPNVGAQSADETPVFHVDAAWPKPLPNNWAVGPVSGISADVRDHIWIIHRGEAMKEAGRVAAPPVIEFDPAGNVVQAWGGPGAGYDWPQQVHGITVDDANGRVWITGNGEKDTHILAFTRAGKFLRQIGRAGMASGSNNTTNVARATQTRVDARAKEIYVSDGELNQNHRVIVFDSETGAYKRHWGAYGEKPDDAAIGTDSAHRQFGSAVHCVRFDRDERVYVCDRSHSRFQIFRKDGTYENGVSVPRVPGTAGTVYDLDFSPDQKFLYVADGANQRVWILRRDDMRVVDWFGERGAGAGQFATSLHDLAVDSKGNIYTGEAAAAGRVQKFARRAPRAATSVKELSAGARDAIANLVLDGGHDDINPALYPTALRSEIRQYLSRSKAYRSTRRLPKNAGGEAEMGHSRQINSERILAASTSDPRAARVAVQYVDALQGCYEWEGMPDCPEEEAMFADKYQLANADGPFRELLPLVAAHLWLCTAEFSKSDSERAARATQGYEKDIAVALKSPSLLIRTAAEGLNARGQCYSP
jgi:DNA-binding beta-propeller fold protein YncE